VDQVLKTHARPFEMPIFRDAVIEELATHPDLEVISPVQCRRGSSWKSLKTRCVRFGRITVTASGSTDPIGENLRLTLDVLDITLAVMIGEVAASVLRRKASQRRCVQKVPALIASLT